MRRRPPLSTSPNPVDIYGRARRRLVDLPYTAL